MRAREGEPLGRAVARTAVSAAAAAAGAAAPRAHGLQRSPTPTSPARAHGHNVNARCAAAHGRTNDSASCVRACCGAVVGGVVVWLRQVLWCGAFLEFVYYLK